MILEEISIRSLLDAMPQPVLLLNLAGEIAAANQAAQRILSLDSDRHVLRFAALRGKTVKQHPLRIAHSLFSIDASPALDQNSNQVGTVLVFENRSDADSDLQHFAYTVAHDLREPVRIINNFAQLAERNPGPSNHLKFVRQGANQISTFVDGLLSYAAAAEELQATETVDCGLVANAAVALLKAEIAATDASIQCDPLPVVNGDELLLLQLFQNLLSNALKYRGSNAPVVRIDARDCGDCFQFSVQDNGMGIQPAYHRRIFGLFTRLHGKQISGTGLGLAKCEKIVRNHGGRIWVDSAPGCGATFYFTLLKLLPQVL